jgi:maltodextrin utilization protein YvdJ
MKIERTDTEIIITLAPTTDIDGVQELIDFLHYREIASTSKARQDEVDELASRVNKQWWTQNKARFLKE